MMTYKCSYVVHLINKNKNNYLSRDCIELDLLTNYIFNNLEMNSIVSYVSRGS